VTASVRGRPSIRLRGYDYSQAGAYFLTICTQDRACLFGEVVEGGVALNAFGRIVAEEWSRTGVLRQDVQVDEFIVMPNHVHGILVLAGSMPIPAHIRQGWNRPPQWSGSEYPCPGRSRPSSGPSSPP
jgi:REP element-mobilizing transposase RayT